MGDRNTGFEPDIVKHSCESFFIPVIASRGAGKVEHFSKVFEKTKAKAALAASVSQKEVLPIEVVVKEYMRKKGIETRWIRILILSVPIEKGLSQMT